MAIPVKTKTSYPVSISEAKRHLRVEDDWHEDDAYIENLIIASTAKAEQYIGKDIAATDNVQTIYDYAGDCMNIPEGNFISLTDVSVGGTSLDVSYTEIFYNYTKVELDSTITLDEDQPMQILYKTGYAEGDCPMLIKQAVLVKIADLYDVDRQSYLMGSIRENKAFESLLDSFRYITF